VIPKIDHPILVDRFGDPLPAGAIARLGTSRLRHGDEIWKLGYFADGKTLLTADSEAVHLWDAATSKLLRRFGDLRDTTHRSLAYSADGRLAAMRFQREEHEAVYLWDTTKGRLLKTLPVARLYYYGSRDWQLPDTVALTADGKTLAVSEFDGKGDDQVRLIDTATGADRHVIRISQGPFYCFAFSVDGKTIFIAGADKKIQLCDVATGEVHRQFDTPYTAGRIVPAPDGKRLATTEFISAMSASRWGKVVTLWDIASGKQSWHLDHKEYGANAIAFTPDGRTVVTSNYGGTRLTPANLYPGTWTLGSTIWCDAATGKELARRNLSATAPQLLAFSPDGKTLATATGPLIYQSPGHKLDSETGAVQCVRFWDAVTGKAISKGFGHGSAVWGTTVSPDGRMFATGTHEAEICLWNLGSKEEPRTLLGHDKAVHNLAFAPGGKTLISDSFDGTVREWDLLTGDERRRFPGFWSALAPDGKTLLVGDINKIVHVWDLTAGKVLWKWQGSGRRAGKVIITTDGKAVCTCCEDLNVRIWELATGKLLQFFPGHRFPDDHGIIRSCCAFSPDGTLAAFGGSADYIALYDTATGKELRRLADPKAMGSVAVLAFSRDGRTLASGNDQSGVVHLWEITSGLLYRQFPGHMGGVCDLSFSADGSMLISGNDDTTALVWDLTDKRTGQKPRLLNPVELQERWTELSDTDAARAQRAIRKLLAVPDQAMALIGERVRPTAAPSAERVAELIKALDSDQFPIRDKAMRELEAMGDVIAPTLQAALDRNPTLELKQRLEALLVRFSSSQRIYTVRIIQLLEQLGTPQAREMLERLSRGEREAQMTREAGAALMRLARQKS
jgi:WD40 repeat protein